MWNLCKATNQRNNITGSLVGMVLNNGVLETLQLLLSGCFRQGDSPFFGVWSWCWLHWIAVEQRQGWVMGQGNDGFSTKLLTTWNVKNVIKMLIFHYGSTYQLWAERNVIKLWKTHFKTPTCLGTGHYFPIYPSLIILLALSGFHVYLQIAQLDVLWEWAIISGLIPMQNAVHNAGISLYINMGLLNHLLTIQLLVGVYRSYVCQNFSCSFTSVSQQCFHLKKLLLF